MLQVSSLFSFFRDLLVECVCVMRVCECVSGIHCLLFYLLEVDTYNNATVSVVVLVSSYQWVRQWVRQWVSEWDSETVFHNDIHPTLTLTHTLISPGTMATPVGTWQYRWTHSSSTPSEYTTLYNTTIENIKFWRKFFIFYYWYGPSDASGLGCSE